MRHEKHLRLLRVLAVSVLLSLGLLGCAGLPEQPQAVSSAASLVVAPISGQARDAITIRGSGFIPGEQVEILMVVDGVPTDLGDNPKSKVANELGAFKAASAIPILATPGLYTIKAAGDKGTVAVAPLEVEEKPKK